MTGPPGPYYRSKVDAEEIARGYQERGVPVVISYPGGVFGPEDPHFGESAQIVTSILKRQLPAVPRGGLSIADVRDVAKAHAAMLEPVRGASPLPPERDARALLVDDRDAAAGHGQAHPTCLPARLEPVAVRPRGRVLAALPALPPPDQRRRGSTASSGIPAATTREQAPISASRPARIGRRSPTPWRGSTGPARSRRARPGSLQTRLADLITLDRWQAEREGGRCSPSCLSSWSRYSPPVGSRPTRS